MRYQMNLNVTKSIGPESDILFCQFWPLGSQILLVNKCEILSIVSMRRLSIIKKIFIKKLNTMNEYKLQIILNWTKS